MNEAKDSLKIITFFFCTRLTKRNILNLCIWHEILFQCCVVSIFPVLYQVRNIYIQDTHICKVSRNLSASIYESKYILHLKAKLCHKIKNPF